MPVPQVATNAATAAGIASLAQANTGDGTVKTLPPYMSITADGRVVFSLDATNAQVFEGLSALGLVSPEDLAWFRQWNEGSGQDPTRLAQIFNDPNRTFAEFELVGLDPTNASRFENALNALQTGKNSGGFLPTASFTNTYVGPTTPGQDYGSGTGTRPVFIGQPPTGGAAEQPYFSSEDILVSATEQPNLYDTFDPYAAYERQDPYSGQVETFYSYRPPVVTAPTLPTYTPAAPATTIPGTAPTAQGPITGGAPTDQQLTFGGPSPSDAGLPPVTDQNIRNLQFLLRQAAAGDLTESQRNFLANLTQDRAGRYGEDLASQVLLAQQNLAPATTAPPPPPAAQDTGPQIGFGDSVVTGTPAPQISDEQRQRNMEFLLRQKEAGKLTESQQAFLEKKGLFADGGIVTSLQDSPVTGDGIESFLVKYQSPESAMRDRRAATLRKNMAALAPRPTSQSGIMPTARRG